MLHGQLLRYGGWVFEGEAHARWAVFLDALGIDWQYRPQREAPILYGGERHTPTFFLEGSEAYLEVYDAQERNREQSVLAPQVRAARLATGTGYAVILVYGTVDQYRPIIFYPKDEANAETLAWLEAMPESLKGLEWDGLPEELAAPGRTDVPWRIAWTRHGVGLDFWAGQLALVACHHEPEGDAKEDPYYGNLIEVLHEGHLVYEAYGLYDPHDPLYVVEDAHSFQPQAEYQAAITAAKTIQLASRPYPTTLN